jgi:NitT/TauT family transport system ATP-binding protein
MTDTPPTLNDCVAPATGVSLALREIHKTFDNGVKAVDGVSLDISAGEFVAILGPSGCGKSTLLRMIAGLDQPTAGTIHRDGQAATAYVFQDPNLLPWRTVLKNVALPLELKGVEKSQRLASARDALQQVGLSDAAARYPA